jgi:hypothetical protein
MGSGMTIPPPHPYLATALLLLAACGRAPQPPPPVGDDAWTFGEGVWNTGSIQVARADVEAAMPRLTGPLTVRLPREEPVGTAVPVLLASLSRGATGWRLGDDGDALVDVAPPPPRDGALVVPVLVHPGGLRVSSPGGAEHELPCGPCAAAEDWPTARLPRELDGAAVDDVAVLFHEGAPWGAVVDAARAIAASGRRVHLARG